MKILIVDDIPQRYSRLTQALERAGVARSNLTFSNCVADARAKLETTKYDLMLLDLLIPYQSDGDPHEKNAGDFLNEIVEIGDLVRPRQIVGISADQDAASKLAPIFEDNLWALIQYSESADTWVSQLLNCVSYIQDQTNLSQPANYQYDLAIICALRDPELEAVLKLPWNWQPSRPIDDCTFIHDGHFVVGGRKITVGAASAQRMGMVSSALLTSKLIFILKPKFVVMTGICAGVKRKTEFGDILFVDPAWDWQSGKRVRDKENSQFSISPHQLDTAAFVRAHVEQLKADRRAISDIDTHWTESINPNLKIVIGPVASGSAVLADGAVVDEIKKQHRDLVGIEMEAYGVYAAAKNASYPVPIPIALKSVCDFGDPEKDDKYQRYASYTSAAVLRLLFERFGRALLDKVR